MGQAMLGSGDPVGRHVRPQLERDGHEVDLEFVTQLVEPELVDVAEGSGVVVEEQDPRYDRRCSGRLVAVVMPVVHVTRSVRHARSSSTMPSDVPHAAHAPPVVRRAVIV
jgi:hypothetical protein